jgi:hypothetical protein
MVHSAHLLITGALSPDISRPVSFIYLPKSIILEAFHPRPLYAFMVIFLFRIVGGGGGVQTGSTRTSATSGLFYLPRVIVRMENLVE